MVTNKKTNKEDPKPTDVLEFNIPTPSDIANILNSIPRDKWNIFASICWPNKTEYIAIRLMYKILSRVKEGGSMNLETARNIVESYREFIALDS